MRPRIRLESGHTGPTQARQSPPNGAGAAPSAPQPLPLARIPPRRPVLTAHSWFSALARTSAHIVTTEPVFSPSAKHRSGLR